jgi:hypothetical protein
MFAAAARTRMIAVVLLATSTPLAAQVIITGSVTNKTHKALAGSAVQLAATRLSTLSDDAGHYRLEVPRAVADTTDSVTVIARRIGFQPVSRRIATRGGPLTIDFELEATAVRLESLTTSGSGVTDHGAPALAKDLRGAVTETAVPASAPAPDTRAARVKSADRVSAKARADVSGVRRGGSVAMKQDPSPGVLTAAIWDDAAHWREYTRFLGRASESSWNPWGLDVGQSTIHPIRATRPRSARRALDLGFLVDATGSMGDEMTFLASELKDIVRRVHGAEPDLDVRLSVVFYRDRGDAFLTKQLPFTRNTEDAVSFISGTTADGGGDFPEDMNAGLDVMMRQSWSADGVPQMLFPLADAPPHQYPGEDYTYHEAIRDAAAKGIAIYPVAASGVDKPTEFLFRAMAVMTGGKYVFLTDDSGVGESHEEPDITGYTVEKLNDLMVREIRSYVASHHSAERSGG